MYYKTLVTATALFGTLGSAGLVTPLPQTGSPDAVKFQPKLDFDTDSCYNTAAVDPHGYLNPGATSSEECRTPGRLQNSNAYVRARCNHNICAYMYEYYFERDTNFIGDTDYGHEHEWENVVVFVENGAKVLRVAASAHGNYPEATNSPILDAGTHPMIVYHKDGGLTHVFRLATDDDIAHPENHFGVFYRSPLVGWNGWPSTAIRQSVLDTWTGVGPKLRDSEFGVFLKKAANSQVGAFDPFADS